MKRWIWCSALSLMIILIIGIIVIFNKDKEEPTTVNNNTDHAVVTNDSGNATTASPTGTEEPKNQEPQVITPSIEGSDIDAVAYETVSAKKTKQSIEAHVIIDDSTENVARFVLPYSDLVKYLNENINSVSVIIYKSKIEADANHASWKFEDGKLHVL